jgi:hypothetical protein
MQACRSYGYPEGEKLAVVPEETPPERPEGQSARFFEAQGKDVIQNRRHFPVGGGTGW